MKSKAGEQGTQDLGTVIFVRWDKTGQGYEEACIAGQKLLPQSQLLG